MRTLHKIGLLLLALVLLPVLVYLADEVASLSENEEMMAGIYEQQLETILYSVNQRAWDVASSWAGTLGRALAPAASDSLEAAYRRFLEATPPLQAIFLADSAGGAVRFFDRPAAGEAGHPVGKTRDVKAALQGSRPELRQLIAQKQAGYQKLLPLLLPRRAGEVAVALVFVPDERVRGQQAQLVGMVLDSGAFIDNVLAPKLQEVARAQFLLGLFREGTAEPVYATGSMRLDEARQTRAVWLFPNYVLGIRLSGTTVEEVMQRRFQQNLVLVLVLALALLTGAWVAYRSIRREIELARMKSDFVSNVSHELRTPLALIRMFVETLEMGRVRSEDQRQEYYRILSQEADRLTRLVNNILNFSRLEAGRKAYRTEAVDLNRAVRDVMVLYEQTLASQGFEVDVDLQADLPPILGDAEAVSEALINLIDNAVKYSDRDKYVALRTRRDGPWVLAEVVDHGMGMPPEEQAKIFEKFYRITTGLVHNTKGTGLGLTLVKHIMDAHGGTVTVESKPGKGSSFKLRFRPVMPEVRAPEIAPRQPILS